MKFLVFGYIYNFICLNVINVLLSAVLMLFTLGEFYMNSFNYGWMPMPYKNHLGYSYWLEVTSSILLIVSVMGCVVAFVFKMLHMYNPHEKDAADDMMLGRQLEVRPSDRY